MNLLYLSVPGGGLDTNVRVLAPAIVRAGHSVSVLYVHYPRAGATAAVPEIEGCRMYHATTRNWHYYFHRATLGLSSFPSLIRSLEFARALQGAVARIAKQSPIDLIELPETFIPADLLAVPYITRLHASAWMCRQLAGERVPSADLIERRWERETLQRASGISSPSEAMAELVRAECQTGDRPIEIIPYPIDTRQFMPGSERANPPLILYVGRVEKRKGADVLLRAIPIVRKRYPECEFVFAGSVSGEIKGSLSQQGEGNLRLLGVRPRAELVDWYRRASVFVAPSIWDNSPNTIYEAMACGTPVVASRVGGIPELVDHGVTGLLVPPTDSAALADALITLLGDSPRREQMGRLGHEKAVSSYVVERIARASLDFYDRVLSK